MTIILDFRFAIFDCGRKAVRVRSSSFSLSRISGACCVLREGRAFLNTLHAIRATRRRDKLKLELHARIASPRGVFCLPVKVVKVERLKSRTCKPLIVNAVKPSQSESHHLAGLTEKIKSNLWHLNSSQLISTCLT